MWSYDYYGQMDGKINLTKNDECFVVIVLARVGEWFKWTVQPQPAPKLGCRLLSFIFLTLIRHNWQGITSS